MFHIFSMSKTKTANGEVHAWHIAHVTSWLTHNVCQRLRLWWLLMNAETMLNVATMMKAATMLRQWRVLRQWCNDECCVNFAIMMSVATMMTVALSACALDTRNKHIVHCVCKMQRCNANVVSPHKTKRAKQKRTSAFIILVMRGNKTRTFYLKSAATQYEDGAVVTCRANARE